MPFYSIDKKNRNNDAPNVNKIFCHDGASIKKQNNNSHPRMIYHTHIHMNFQ